MATTTTTTTTTTKTTMTMTTTAAAAAMTTTSTTTTMMTLTKMWMKKEIDDYALISLRNHILSEIMSPNQSSQNNTFQ